MKAQKPENYTPENRAEMARQGTMPHFGYLIPRPEDLKAPRGCVFKKMAGYKYISAICEVFHKNFLKCAKMPFKAPPKGGLKLRPDFAKKSVTFHPCFFKKGGFCHVKMV